MGGFIAGDEDGFGIFEMWTQRLGYFPARRSGTEAFGGNLLIFAYPNKVVSEEFREGLRQYVEKGGRVLVLDAMGNKASTANALLLPFGLTVSHEAEVSGVLKTPTGWPITGVTGVCAVQGGQALAEADGRCVGAVARCGMGSVTAIGFGSRFADLRMGVTADAEPKPEIQDVYELEYSLLRGIVEDNPPPAGAAGKAG